MKVGLSGVFKDTVLLVITKKCEPGEKTEGVRMHPIRHFQKEA